MGGYESWQGALDKPGKRKTNEMTQHTEVNESFALLSN